MKGVKIVDIKKVTEVDGTLFAMEADMQIPFPIKRIFLVKDVVPGKTRGDHATKRTKLVLFPVSGSCRISVDNGTEKETFLMDDASKGLYIEEMIWRSMFDFSRDCVMMAVCDRPFEPGNETYDNFDEFISMLGKRKCRSE